MKKGNKKWYQSYSNWIVIIACVILIPMLIMNLSIMFQAKKDENAVPSVFGYKPFMVLSGSMETEIHKGDLIITKIIDPKKLKIDDVIAFRDAENTVTTHRIIDMVERNGETYFITKGDNNSSQDQNLVSLNDVEGIYVGRIPGIGSIMDSLAKPTTIVILVLGITVIFGIAFTISNKKQREKEQLEFLEYKRMKEQQKNNDYYNNNNHNNYNSNNHYNNRSNNNNYSNQNRYNNSNSKQYSNNNSNKNYSKNYNNRNSNNNNNNRNFNNRNNTKNYYNNRYKDE